MATQKKPTPTKPALVKDDQRVTDAGKDPTPRPVYDAADATTEPVHAAGMFTPPAPELMIQLVRHGLNFSLRSVQVWADLARQLGPAPPDSTANASMVCLAYDGFEKLLATQREMVDQLVTIQRQLAQRYSDATTLSDLPTPR